MQEAFEKLKGNLISVSILAFPDFEKQVIVEIDASCAADTKFSQKKKDSKFYLVQLAGRTMNSSECNYFECERETLAIKFSLKKFRPYLLVQPFKLIKAHHNVQYTFKKLCL